MTRKCHAQFWIGGGESDLSADHKLNKTLSGVPQGSILSPILSNILLSKLDRFVENELMPQYNTGRKRKANRTYRSLINRAHRLRKQGQKEAAHKIKQQAQKLPAIDPQDPDYRRLKYCRYADDFAVRHDVACVEWSKGAPSLVSRAVSNLSLRHW